MTVAASVGTRLADRRDIGAVARLFDSYRRFYGREADEDGAHRFIGERMEAGDSVVIVAEHAGEAIGFTQLYPSFTSVGMARIFVLNDLFVDPAHRGSGAGRALLDAAADHARGAGAVRLTLSTQTSNSRAQAVYEAGGWERDAQFHVYTLNLMD